MSLMINLHLGLNHLLDFSQGMYLVQEKMEHVLDLVTMKSNDEYRVCIMNQDIYPFRISDFLVPHSNTGYVYMLISVRDLSFTHIGITNFIRTIIQIHNSGFGSLSTKPSHLRPYTLFAYIWGLGGRRDLLFYMEIL